jgi:uncharacterized protein (DUF697 family)/tellurite resistance protein
MPAEIIESILSIAILAAFADGAKDERERAEVRRIAESLAGESGASGLAARYQDVLMKRVTLSALAAQLDSPELRNLAYEMAVCVCDADGRQSEAERRFLAELGAALGLGADVVAELAQTPDALAELTPPAAAGWVTRESPAPSVASAAAAVAPPAAVQPAAAELDRTVLNHAVLAGALELLPQSWASMAIIPLQLKLVHRVGELHGVSLDQGHIKEFLAAAGVGLASQYLEQVGRKLIGGLLGKAAGKWMGGLGRTATSMAFSFATTYALGQVARQYYAGGRRLSTEQLRQTFQQLLGPAKDLQQRYIPQIETTARGLDAQRVMAMLKGSVPV